MRCRAAVASLLAQLCCAAALLGDITSATLQIQGLGLEIETTSVTTPVDVGTTIQTRFGGKSGDDAPSVEGLLAVGELSGPALDQPIQLTTAPGHPFRIPGLGRTGVYTLSNVRLMKGSELVAPATPNIATITVADILQTSLKVRQLTADELRARGIRLDGSSWTAWDYSFTFMVNGSEVVIPYPIAIDPRTHEVVPIGRETPYSLPAAGQVKPPRWSPPDIVVFELPVDEEAFASTPDANPMERTVRPKPVSVPAAIVIPNSLAALHEFFAVLITVTNGAPSGSTARIDDVNAIIKLPAALRAASSKPSVSFGVPVPVVDPTTGVTFLVAQAKGEAEWNVEGLAPGTHTVEIEVRATLREIGQPDIPLKAVPRASIVVQDPKFNVTFSHPAVVRKGIDYSTFSFITNSSSVAQTVRIRNGVPSCDQSPGANVCRVGGNDVDELTFAAGEMRTIEYKLRPGITGQVFATAGSVQGDNITAAVELHLGVSASGIPLSPATLILPYYAQFVSPAILDANLQLLGLGYSLATAPLTQATAKFPKVIRSDVFYRAVDLSRAGQRIFISDGAADEKFNALATLTLDLLGNSVQLDEWDELRRSETSGRTAMASVFAELSASGMAGRNSIGELVDRFGAATSYRSPFAVALVHGPVVAGNRFPYPIEVRDASGRRMALPNEAGGGWVRGLPFSDISRFDVASLGRTGEIAVIGRWTENLELLVTPAVSGPFDIEVVLPAAADGSATRAHLQVTGVAGETLRIPMLRGATTLNALLPNGGFAGSAAATEIPLGPLQVVGARQDLHLDAEGHEVSVLFNRPVAVQDGADLRSKFAARVAFNRDGVTWNGNRQIFAAAMQDGARIVNLSLDQVLTTNADYDIEVMPLVDPMTRVEVGFSGRVRPKIDNTRPAGIIYGKFLKGDNTPIGSAEVRLYTGHLRGCLSTLLGDEPGVDCNPYREAPQYLRTETDGTFLFEYVPRDIIADPELKGSYRLLGVSTTGRYTVVDGAVRLPGRVQFVNLQLLGRGAAEGVVRYEDGARVAGAHVFVGSTMFNIGRSALTDGQGAFHAEDLPVGPITISATDAAGNVAYAAAEIATPGQVVTKDLVIVRKPYPGVGTVFGVVRRSDTTRAAAGARVGIFSGGFAVAEAFTDSDGRFEFRKVPAGFITVLAADWSIGRESAAVDFDLRSDETRETNLTIAVQSATEPLAVLAGDVLRENPLYPGDASKYERVAGALVKIGARAAITADSVGHFVAPALPLSVSGAGIDAYDPVTKRIGHALAPTLTEAGPNNVSIFIPANAYGKGSIRVKLLDAAGYPVPGFRVIEPGYPPTRFVDDGNGIYEEVNVPVGATVDIWAVNGPAAYGDQYAHTTARVDFPGQVVAASMRLPGQGKIRVKVRADFDLIGDVTLSYRAWDEAEQALALKTSTASTNENGVAGYATFSAVPATVPYSVETMNPAHGYASAAGTLAYEGDLATHTLQLSRLATIRGTVYAIDGTTPISGAALRLEDGRRDTGVAYTQADGSFVYTDVPAGISFRITADIAQSGIFRTGVAYGRTPDSGGVVDGVAVVLRRRGSVEGRIVYAGYKRFDPNNPANNVADDTPSDLSDNAPVPLAKLWLRELDFPNRNFGSDVDPLAADATGRFAFSNIFVGGLRASAWDPSNQELRGDWAGTLSDEGQLLANVYIAIGAGGTGTIQASVVDPNQSFAPVANAEVSLFRGGVIFDLRSSDASGVARFDQLPIGSYVVNAYSKSLGKSGTAGASVQKDLIADARVILSFSGKVDGTLTDPETVQAGQGVAGAPVTLTGEGYQTRASTTPAGAFSFDGIREGTFRLDAKDTVSNRRATATRALSAADPHPIVNLELERTETLYLGVYLPDDSGANSGVLAGPVAVDVVQRNGDFMRSVQGNPITVPKLLATAPYTISGGEIGGARRQIAASASFPKGSAADPLKLVYPAYGDVVVSVTQAGAPAAGATVRAGGSGRSVSLVTDGSGEVAAHQIPLGPVSAQAISLDGAFSGSGSATLQRQSVPARINIDLAAYAGITGLVEAEGGGPSVGTRVAATFAGRALEMVTDADGRYTFRGIPTSAAGTAVSLVYVGPDGVTVGGHYSLAVTTADASHVIALPTIRLDATPPQLISLSPADGTQNVSPDSAIRFVFSERLRGDQVSNAFLQLVPADGSGQVMASFDVPIVAADGTFSVTMRAPPPPSDQRFPLRSNTLYRVIVSGAIEDLTGHTLPAPRGATFTTSDYAEPRVVKVVPAESAPLPEQVTLQFIFNEPIDASAWQSGGAGVFHLYRLSAAGASGQIIGEKSGRAYVDPANSTTLVFAPNDLIEPESFYRAVFSGVRDLQGNALAEQTFHFFSFDRTKPFARLISPVPDGIPLISGVEYVLGIDLRNGVPDGTPATDVVRVDYARVDGTVETYLTTTSKSPFAYRFVAPEAPQGGQSLSIRARATDASANVSDPATLTWSVQPNTAPKNVAVVLSPAAVYPSNVVSAVVSFDDEGTLVTVAATMTGTRRNGSAWSDAQTRQVARASVGVPWTAAQFTFSIPPDIDPAKAAACSGTVTDVRGLGTAATAPLTLLTDTAKPAFVSLMPAAESSFHVNDTYTIEAVASDGESGVAEVTFTADGHTWHVPASSAVAGPTPGSKRFSSPPVIVPAKNVDTRVTITAVATDYAGNSTERRVDVIYLGVNDPAVPKGAWVCPLDRAALPANSSMSVPLRVRATDDIAVTSVKFRITGVVDPVVATRLPGSDDYVATPTVLTPAAGAALTATAIISDADPLHTVELPIAIDVIAVDQTIDATVAITADNRSQFDGASVVIRGAAGRLVTHVPVTLRNLLVLDGASVESLPTTTSTEQKVDITIIDHLYIDCASSIDVTARGYLGGWGANADGSGTRNESAAGRTAGNQTTGGASNAAAAHGGLGAAGERGKSNEPYDSIAEPSQAGSGGSGSAACCTAGGAGGGIVLLRTSGVAGALGTFTIAGSIRADGGGDAATYSGGAGGTVRIAANQLITGPLTRISANGGDGLSTVALSGGGGRVSISASERLDIDATPPFEARGGVTASGLLTGGAGTIFVRRPGQADGELHLSGAGTVRPPRSTPLGYVKSGVATATGTNSITDASRLFDAAAAGERVLIGSKIFKVTAISADRHTLITDEADGNVSETASAGASYRGVLHFDRVELGPNTLARFDESFSVAAGVLDDPSMIVRDGTAVLMRYADVPSLSFSTSPAPNGNLIRATNVDVQYSAGSPAGLLRTVVNLSASSPTEDKLTTIPPSVAARHLLIPVPADASLGPASLTVRAIDRADRIIEGTPVAFTIIDNTPPVITSFTATPEVVFPGQTISANIAAADDVAVTKLSLTTRIGEASPVVTTVPAATTPASHTFNVAVPITTPGGTVVTLDGAAEDGFPGRPPVIQSKSITIAKDRAAPAVSIVSPVPDQLFDERSGATFALTVNALDADVGTKAVMVTVGDAPPVAMVPAGVANQWRADLPVPNVDGIDPVPIVITVTATDYEGNAATAAVTIRVRPLLDPNAPSIAWSCSATGAMVPAGYTATLRVTAKPASPSNGVQKIEFFVGGSSTALIGLPVSGAPYEYAASWTVPDLADGSVVDVRAVATSVSGNAADVTSRIIVVSSTAPQITGDLTINAANASLYDGKSVIVRSGIVTIDGAHTFDRLIVLSGALVTQVAGPQAKLSITTTRGAFIACGGSVDATGAGYPAGQTDPAAALGGSSSGASHLGVGGEWTAPSATTYGSVIAPNEPGSSSADVAGGPPGGGVIRLTAAALHLEGAIRANGRDSTTTSGSASAGSVWITATSATGGGVIEANGGSGSYGTGGGGAIALDVAQAVIPWKACATGGSSSAGHGGGAGFVLMRRSSSAFGDAVVDNRGSIGGRTDLPSLGRGVAQNGSSGSTLVTDRSADVPQFFKGHSVLITSAAGAVKGTWRIATIAGRSVVLEPANNEAIAIEPGDRWYGIYRFDSLTLRSARLTTADRLIVTATPDLDAQSSIGGNNLAPPAVDLSRISLQASPIGISVAGSAGAVTDPDQPVIVSAVNARTGQLTTANVLADGSFSVAVFGNAGDAISIKARDSNYYPLETPLMSVGTLAATAAPAVQVDRSTWTADPLFRAQRLGVDGNTLVVSSAGVNGSSSDKLVLLDTTDRARPVLLRTLATGNANIRDVKVVDGWAYVAGNYFGTIDLHAASPVMNFAESGFGAHAAVAVAGSYAFTAETYITGGHIFVFDVSTPGSPRYLGMQAALGPQGEVYTDLLPFGRYLAAVANDTAGRDLVIIDRSEPTAMKKIGELQIANFTAWRGAIRGSLLYLVGPTSPEVVVVDLSAPASPTVVARVQLGSGAAGVRLLEGLGLVANTTAGLTITSPVPPVTVKGSAPMDGTAMDVAVSGGWAYVADESGLAIVPMDAGPVIEAGRISLALAGTMVTVTGKAGAVTGSAPLSVTVTNQRTSAALTLTGASDGSFAASLPAVSGDVISIRAADGQGRTAGPVEIGAVPFGSSTTTVSISIPSEPAFRARTVKVEGPTAIVASYPVDGATSNKVVVFDVSGARPVQTRVIDTFSSVRDVELIGGWVYVAGNGFGTIDLRSGVPVLNWADARPAGDQGAVAVDGGYAFTAAMAYGESIGAFDVSNPSAPHYVGLQPIGSTSGTPYSDLLSFGRYLIGISNDVSGRVVVIDRRDPSALRRVASLQIPEIAAFRGRIEGSFLYVAGKEGGVAVIDLSNAASPRVVAVRDTPGQAYGIDVSGSTIVVADRALGAAFLESTSGSLRMIGSHPVAGDAWDVAFGGTAVYVASDIGLSVIAGVTAPPKITSSLITVASDGRVLGAAGAVAGQGSIRIDLTNTATAAGVSAAVNVDGSFAAVITGSAGDGITIKATDGDGRTAGPIPIGAIPFGSSTATYPLSIAAEPAFRVRTIAVEGSAAIVASYPLYGANSTSLVTYDVTGATPVRTRTIGGFRDVRDVKLIDGWAYVAGAWFGTIDLRSATSPVNAADAFPPGTQTAVAVAGGYAFASQNYFTDGRIIVYDVSNPAAPRYLATEAPGGVDGMVYSDLLPLGTDWLIGISNDVAGRDVVIIDRRDARALKKVAELQIPGIVGFRGRISGSVLYVAGQDGGIASIDLSSPASPVLLSVLDTPGAAYGIDVSGSTVMIADRGVGVTFAEGANTLRLIGTHAVDGDSWDVALGGTSLYVASDIGLSVISNVVAPPDIVPQLVTIASSSASTATISGAPYAVVGQAPVQVSVTPNNGTTVSTTAAAAGSFNATVAARPGDSISIAATDRYGRTSTMRGAVPFASLISAQPATSASDTALFGRRIATDGSNIFVTDGTVYGTPVTGGSTRALLFRQPNASEPAALSLFDTAAGSVLDSDISGGHAWVTGQRFTVIDYLSAPPAAYAADFEPNGRKLAVVVPGNGYAYTAEGEWFRQGSIHIYDVRTPSTPKFVKTVAIASGGPIDYRKLITGGSFIYAISPEANRDVTIIDISNPKAPVRVSELDVPGFAAFNGALDGTTLYLSGGDGGVAVVDVSNPSGPQLLSIVDTPGIARSIAVSGPGEIVVADSSGLTFIDTSDRRRPVVLGSQPLDGTASDVKVKNGEIYVATETRFFVLKRP